MSSADNTMVGFKNGTQAQIDALSTFSTGTFYIATDTGNMYLGMNDGSKVLVGGASSPKFHFSTSEPTGTDGQDGDVWFVYEA